MMHVSDLLNCSSDEFWNWWGKKLDNEEFKQGIFWVESSSGLRNTTKNKF